MECQLVFSENDVDDDFTENGARYIVENVFEELDSPGEWYLNITNVKLSYFPYPDEKIDSISAFALVLPELIRFEGDPEYNRFIENISFRNIKFIYTNYDLPAGDVNDAQVSAEISAAISMKGTRRVDTHFS